MSAGEDEFAQHCAIYKIPALREYRFDLKRKWRFDFIILPADLCARPSIAVEIEGGVWNGGRHSRGKGMEADMEKYNAAALAGFRVFRFSPAMVHSGAAIDTIREAIK